MNSNELNGILSDLRAYLEREKVFIKNPFREQEVNRALEIINALFPNSVREIKNDPLQMGAVILTVDGNDIVVRGDEELALFAELTSLVDNFEIYATKGNQIHFAAVMQEVLVRIQQGK
jgi:hypothetical protein